MSSGATVRDFVERTAKAVPIYLIVFCFYLPLSIYEKRGHFFDRYSIVPAVLILLITVLILFAVLHRTLRNNKLAGLLALTGLMLLFPNAIVSAPIFALAALIGIAVVLTNVLRHRQNPIREAVQLPNAYTAIVNAVAVTIFTVLCFRALYDHIVVVGTAQEIAEETAPFAHTSRPIATPDVLPHIVHIVLDGYSRGDVLRTTYNFDNSPFLNALRQRGFLVSERATTPFNQTLFVMGSIFALGDITLTDTIQFPEEDHSSLRRSLAYGVEHGTAVKILRELGYSVYSTPSTFMPMQWNNIADAGEPGASRSHFQLPGTYTLSYNLLEHSPIFKYVNRFLLGNSFNLMAVHYWNLKEVPNRRFRAPEDSPLFIYQHILAPHPPFLITPDGMQRPLGELPPTIRDSSSIIVGDESKRSYYREGYIDKLKYINDAILEQIDRLKSTLSEPLIIILHGDHGGGMYHEQDDKANTCIKERFSPLFAIYASDDATLSEFTDDFNIINTYRAVFRALLNADLPNLPSRSTFISYKLDSAAEINSSELVASCPTQYQALSADNAKPNPSPARSATTSR